uniref:Polyprotein n=1 Tax=Sclerotium rolfsii beny-like virus 1 TaxID=2490821 RepID=A0A3G8EX11_9VIRU|nr:polyprotein [Sclerotium rolfsii beny-like virus 1]
MGLSSPPESPGKPVERAGCWSDNPAAYFCKTHKLRANVGTLYTELALWRLHRFRAPGFAVRTDGEVCEPEEWVRSILKDRFCPRAVQEWMRLLSVLRGRHFTKTNGPHTHIWTKTSWSKKADPSQVFRPTMPGRVRWSQYEHVEPWMFAQDDEWDCYVSHEPFCIRCRHTRGSAARAEAERAEAVRDAAGDERPDGPTVDNVFVTADRPNEFGVTPENWRETAEETEVGTIPERVDAVAAVLTETAFNRAMVRRRDELMSEISFCDFVSDSIHNTKVSFLSAIFSSLALPVDCNKFYVFSSRTVRIPFVIDPSSIPLPEDDVDWDVGKEPWEFPLPSWDLPDDYVGDGVRRKRRKRSLAVRRKRSRLYKKRNYRWTKTKNRPCKLRRKEARAGLREAWKLKIAADEFARAVDQAAAELFSVPDPSFLTTDSCIEVPEPEAKFEYEMVDTQVWGSGDCWTKLSSILVGDMFEQVIDMFYDGEIDLIHDGNDFATARRVLESLKKARADYPPTSPEADWNHSAVFVKWSTQEDGDLHVDDVEFIYDRSVQMIELMDEDFWTTDTRRARAYMKTHGRLTEFMDFLEANLVKRRILPTVEGCKPIDVEVQVGSDAAGIVNSAMQVLGTDLAKPAAARQFDDDLKSTPTVPYRMTSSQLAQFSAYVGTPVVSSQRLSSLNDHLMLQAARSLLRDELRKIFPHNADGVPVLHVGATMHEVRAYWKHEAHDFALAMVEDKDISRTHHDAAVWLARIMKEANLPSLNSANTNAKSVCVDYPSLEDVLKAAESGGRRRSFVKSYPKRKYGALVFEDCLYKMSEAEFGSIWEKTDASVGYATLFIPDPIITEQCAPSDIYNYERYLPSMPEIAEFVKYAWPSCLAFTPLIPFQVVADAVEKVWRWVLDTGWETLGHIWESWTQSGFPIESILGTSFDVMKISPIVRQILDTYLPIIYDRFCRVSVTWKDGFSHGYDEQFRLWKAWTKPRHRYKNFCVDMEVQARFGEMYLLRFTRTSGASDIVTSLALPKNRHVVLVADIEKSYDRKVGSLGSMKYFPVLASHWYKILNWCLDQPPESLSFAVVMTTLNRIRGGLSLGSRRLVEEMNIEDGDVAKIALSALMEAYNRHAVIDIIENDPEMKASYETHLVTFLKKAARFGLTLATGGLAVPAYFLFRWLWQQDRQIEFVKYPAPPKVIREVGKPVENFEERPIRVILPVTEEKVAVSGCQFCDMQAAGYFSADGNANSGQALHVRQHNSEPFNFKFSESEMAEIINEIRNAETFHGTSKVTAHIRKLKHFAETHIGGADYSFSLDYIMGGPGTGKSVILRKLAYDFEARGKSVVIEVPFNALQPDYIACDVIGAPGKHTFKVNTTWYTPQHGTADVYIVDEITASNWRHVCMKAYFLGATHVIVAGDHSQTGLRPEANEGANIFDTLGSKAGDIRTHELVYNYRMDAWRVRLHNMLYGYKMIPKRKDMIPPKIITLAEYRTLNLDKNKHKEMVYRHDSAERIFGVASAPGSQEIANLSIRSAQGRTSTTAAIALLDADSSMTGDKALVNVGNSRATHQTYYVVAESVDDPVAKDMAQRLHIDTPENIERVANHPLPTLKETSVQILNKSQGALEQHLRNKKIEGSVWADNERVYLEPGDDTPFDSGPQQAQCWVWDQFETCLFDHIRKVRPDLEPEMRAYLLALWDDDDAMGRTGLVGTMLNYVSTGSRPLTKSGEKWLLPVARTLAWMDSKDFRVAYFEDGEPVFVTRAGRTNGPEFVLANVDNHITPIRGKMVRVKSYGMVKEMNMVDVVRPGTLVMDLPVEGKVYVLNRYAMSPVEHPMDVAGPAQVAAALKNRADPDEVEWKALCAVENSKHAFVPRPPPTPPLSDSEDVKKPFVRPRTFDDKLASITAKPRSRENTWMAPMGHEEFVRILNKSGVSLAEFRKEISRLDTPAKKTVSEAEAKEAKRVKVEQLMAFAETNLALNDVTRPRMRAYIEGTLVPAKVPTVKFADAGGFGWKPFGFKVLRSEPVEFESALHADESTGRAPMDGLFMADPTPDQIEEPVVKTKFRAGTDAFRMARFLDPSQAFPEDRLNFATQYAGVEETLDLDVNVDGILWDRTPAGKLKRRARRTWRQISPGLGNHYTDQATENIAATKRYSDIKKPAKRRTAESDAWCRKVVNEAWEQHYRKDYLLGREERNWVVNGALRDACRRRYWKRGLQARAKWAGHSLTYSGKAQFKPEKNGKLNLEKSGQGLMQSPADFNNEWISWARVHNFMLKDAAKDTWLTDNRESEGTFRTKVTAGIQALPGRPMIAMVDATTFDAQQSQVTVFIERESWHKFGTPYSEIDDFQEIRKPNKFIAHGQFKGKHTGQKGSGFLDTLSGNTLLESVLVAKMFNGKGPMIEAGKGDDYIRVQNGITVNEARVKEVEEYTGIKFVTDVGYGGEFIGCTVSAEGMFPSVTRTAMKAMAARIRDADHFYEYQKSLRDKVLEWRRTGITETIAVSADAENKSQSYVEACLAFVNSMSHMSYDQYVSVSKKVKEVPFNLPPVSQVRAATFV